MTAKPTKAASKGQRKARNRNRRKISLAGGEVALAPVIQGQRPKPEDARKVALQARVRVYGIKGDDPTDKAKDPMCGSGVGMCIATLAHPIDRQAAWRTWHHLCVSQHNYRTRIIGMTGNPQGSAIAMQPDRMETDQSLHVDLRTPEERDAAAIASWARAEAAIKALPAPQMIWAVRGALSGGMDGMGGDVWVDGEPTDRGRVLVLALVAMGGKY